MSESGRAHARVMRLAIGSVVVGLLVMALKALAWALTGSLALMSDALESVVNLATALAVIVALKVARRPADDNHPFGHHKAEFFSAVLEGVLIVIAALFILREAYDGFQAPRAMEEPFLGMAINMAAGGINALWALMLMRNGRRYRSPALVADGKHLMTDVVSSVGVLIGVGLALATGWLWLDPAMAVLVAFNILWSGSMVIKASLSGLMDEAVSDKELAKIRRVIATAASDDAALEAHDLRTRHAGPVTFIEFHLVMPGETTVEAAHDLCDRIEAALMAALPGARVTIHVEPEHKAKHSGHVVLS
ncbi:MAG: cation transporter [Roseovarius sp.]|uniref:cation diffusion facilitator family transporter n=1 Tax=Roseovarius sp. TaxID=1486281 RepID=UPI001B3CF977|nr:cation diffusion facilitator family transporter [Roseovarius sp.]MBQ0750633.1 cation transporter [Roseovarius sp.]MBQ0810290.1 cation transporter [Roseovarius sp.]